MMAGILAAILDQASGSFMKWILEPWRELASLVIVDYQAFLSLQADLYKGKWNFQLVSASF